MLNYLINLYFFVKSDLKQTLRYTKQLTLSLQASCSLTGPVHPAIPATPPIQVLDLILIPSPQDAEHVRPNWASLDWIKMLF